MPKFSLLLSVLLLILLQTAAGSADTIVLDGRDKGRTFEGLGVASTSASARMLIEYPEPQRSQILDFLFKPSFGAAPHHLKVEIGGDANSTDGVEPSHARTREEFEHPRPEFFNRGYEWFMMREAKKRNPKMYIDVLQWGAPAWLGDKEFPGLPDSSRLDQADRTAMNFKRFYTQDNADFIVSFIRGAKQYHGVDVDFCGVWNEVLYDVPWIKRLRKTLDYAGLGRVGIVAADQCYGNVWYIAEAISRDPELKKAICAVGAHYPGYRSTAAAKACGKPLWSSEDSPFSGGWVGARSLAKMCNRNYIEGRITKTVVCTLVGSYYDSLPVPSYGTVEGSVLANTPWSGHYLVRPSLWAFAHTAQFTCPGWKYLDRACGLLKAGGSYVSLRRPEIDGDYSIIIETGDAKAPQTLSFRIVGRLATGPVHVWRSNKQSQFDQLADVPLNGDSFSLLAEPDSIYTLTTTSGQHKGTVDAVPPAADFPMPYRDDFERSLPGTMPRYFSDQGGVFEVALRPGGGRCLRQTVARHGIDWKYHPIPNPYTMIGSPGWHDYEVGCDACVEKAGHVVLYGRIALGGGDTPEGYGLKVDANGRWELKACTKVLASGTVPFGADHWHRLALKFLGRTVAASIDGAVVAAIEDHAYNTGMAGLGTGWNNAMFDNFFVRPVADTE